MAEKKQSEPLLSTGLLKGILLLGVVGAAGFVAYKWWQSAKVKEPATIPDKTVSVPITLPVIKKTKAKKKKA